MADAFPVSGTIDAKTFPYLITNLHRESATGSLKVDGPSYQKALYIKGGRILFGSSNDPRDQLGAILIDAGKLSPEQLEEMSGKVGPGNPLAKVLADSGLVTQQELSEAARLKVERILRDVLSYSEGAFDFEDGVLPKGAVDLKLNTYRLVLGAVQKIADRSFVLGHIGSLQTILETTGDATSIADIRAEVGPLFDQIDGRRTLKDVIGQTALEEFEAAKMACALLFLGAVRPVGAAQSAPAQPPEDAPFFAPPEGSGLDLGDTARLAFAEPEPEAEAETMTAPPDVMPSLEFAVSESPAPSPGPPMAIVEPEPEAPMGFALSDEPEIEVAAADVGPDPDAPTLSVEAEIPTLRMPPTAQPTRGGGLAGQSSLPLIPPPKRSPRAASPASSLPEDHAPDTEVMPSIRPPSRDDLAALDAILNPQGAAEPAARSEPAVPTTYHALQRFGPQGIGRRPKSRGMLVPLIFVIVALGAVAGWWFFLRGPEAPRVVAEPTLAPISEASPLPANPAQPTPDAVGVIGAGPTPVPAGSPEETALPAGTAAPTPAPTAAPTVAPVATPQPQPQARPPAADGRSLLAAGQYRQAAGAFVTTARALPANTLAIQILVACSSETVSKAVAAVGSDQLILLPVDFRGRACFRLCWGTYDNASSASSALASVPAYFRQGGAQPKVVPLATVLP